ncbi:hypothetical protein Tco_1169119, partial [Tanacetum coccineum]
DDVGGVEEIRVTMVTVDLWWGWCSVVVLQRHWGCEGGMVSVVMWGGGDGAVVGDEGRRQVAGIRPEVAGAAPENIREMCVCLGL